MAGLAVQAVWLGQAGSFLSARSVAVTFLFARSVADAFLLTCQKKHLSEFMPLTVAHSLLAFVFMSVLDLKTH